MPLLLPDPNRPPEIVSTTNRSIGNLSIPVQQKRDTYVEFPPTEEAKRLSGVQLPFPLASATLRSVASKGADWRKPPRISLAPSPFLARPTNLDVPHRDNWTVFMTASFSQNAMRIIDVNANRAAEGLRVVEEYLRFVSQNPGLAQHCKQIRHDLAAKIAQLGPQRVSARDTSRDVGRALTTEKEFERGSLHDVAIASLNRVQQAMRCLEEYGKLANPIVAASFEGLRYQSYELESAIRALQVGTSVLKDAKLYVLIDGADGALNFEKRVRQLVDSRVDMLQLRDKQLDDRQLLQRAHALRKATADSTTLMIVNDRPDIACLSGADGVHLGQDDMQVHEARQIMGTEPLIGVSTHSLTEAQQAVSDSANYIGVGPTFPSQTKQFADFPGLALLKQISDQVALPAFAIGGIGWPETESVLNTGIHRVAVGAAIWNSPQPAEQVARFRQQLTPAVTSTSYGDTP
ncbi:MAG: thiamine phosphate synthase [Pirellulaceae bacterium]|nr:thiamine phosphate synthase [Pirellulaceae bacterium]